MAQSSEGQLGVNSPEAGYQQLVLGRLSVVNEALNNGLHATEADAAAAAAGAAALPGVTA